MKVILLQESNILFWLPSYPYLSVFPKLHILLFGLAGKYLAYHHGHLLGILTFLVQLNNILFNNQICRRRVTSLDFHRRKFQEFLRILKTHLQSMEHILRHLYLALPFLKRNLIFLFQFIAGSFLHFEVYV